MSDEHSFTLQRAATEYRELGSKLRELARAAIFPGPRRSLMRLAGSFDRRAAHFDSKAAGCIHFAGQGRGTPILPPRVSGT